MYYTLKDHQGSLAAVVHGNTVERLSYDPWGRRRNTTDFGYGNVSHTFDRGYTLHEHYDDFDLINMNGRMYDPVMSGFLSVDQYVQSPGNSQNFNRYAYCLNNPLRYVDPSGELIWESVLVGAFIGAFTNTASRLMSGSVNNGAQFWVAAGIGAISGGLGGAAGYGASAAVSNIFGNFGVIPGFLTNASGGFTSSFVSTSISSWCSGGTFSDGLLAGLKAGIICGITAGLIGAHNGAMDAKINDLDLWTGEGSKPFYIEKVEYDYVADPDLDLDAELKQRYKSTYNIKTGSYGIKEITTEIGSTSQDRYKLNDNGTYFDLKEKRIVGGFYRPKNHSIHICPYSTMGEDYIFKAAAGHELIHAYHHYRFGSLFIDLYSESVAYEYTQNVYTAAGKARMADKIFNLRLDNIWIYYPSTYAIPNYLPFSPNYVLPKTF